MRASRVAKLERLVRSRPCSGCGQPFDPPDPDGETEWNRLNAAEQSELTELLAVATTPACVRCGRPGHDLRRATDEQLDRALQLLRKLCGQTRPELVDFYGAFARGESAA